MKEQGLTPLWSHLFQCESEYSASVSVTCLPWNGGSLECINFCVPVHKHVDWVWMDDIAIGHLVYTPRWKPSPRGWGSDLQSFSGPYPAAPWTYLAKLYLAHSPQKLVQITQGTYSCFSLFLTVPTLARAKQSGGCLSGLSFRRGTHPLCVATLFKGTAHTP